jgi:cell division septum initiation protein DivIVA
MKKINSIKQLQAEKKRIEQHREQLENKIADNWNELKINLKPTSLVKDAFSSVFRKKERDNQDNGSIVKSALSCAASWLAKRVADKAGRKLSRIYRRK